ncbi:hypothetical protein [Pseudomonas moorei]|uniref:hypothetical protein n=1 Tax=Pseudomonas moorei TaxID=395599 RepID=UPI00200EC54E|nr:hypothetical protein [Pseudomonas moorei]
MNQDQIEANLARHRAQPDVSPAAYFNKLCSVLGAEVAPKTKIYLDTCYWVVLRDAAFGKARLPEHAAILEVLRELVRSGRVVCPVSDAAFVETMQHADPDTRLATASLLDELSSGICLRTEHERVTMELKRFMDDPGGCGGVDPNVAWVRPGMVLGVQVPVAAALDPRVNRILQKSAIDLMWNMTFRDLAVQDSNDHFANVMENSAKRINEKMVAYAPDIRSFKQAFAAEVSGTIKFFDDQAARSFLTERLKTFSEDDVEQFKDKMQTVLFNVFRLRPKIMAQRAPTLYVHAACHAAIRWDKSRRLNGHWLMDLHHACAAAGYHNVMFTEGPLRVLMTSGHLKLDEEFDMPVIAGANDALDYLCKLQSTSADTKMKR